MTLTEVRYRLAKPIIAYNLLALVLSIVFYVSGFIDTDDLNTLVSLLIPISESGRSHLWCGSDMRVASQ